MLGHRFLFVDAVFLFRFRCCSFFPKGVLLERRLMLKDVGEYVASSGGY